MPLLLRRLRRAWPLIVFCLALSLAIAGAAWLLRPSVSEPATAPAAQLRQSLAQQPEAWKAHRGELSELLEDWRQARLDGVLITDQAIYARLHDGSRYWLADDDGQLAGLLLQRYAADPEQRFALVLEKSPSQLRAWLLGAVLLGLLALAATFAWRQRRRGGARRSGPGFAAVIGAQEAKQALGDVLSYLREPQRYAALGARPPRGVLLTGEPGTGKTQLARALAEECDAAFLQVTGSDFSSMYFGVGIAKVRALFRDARRLAPCIVFIDEIDGIGKRAEQIRSSDAEGNRIINRLLTELDGFEDANGILVLGATNFPDSLDPALLREGRFDRRIAVGLPGLADREALFALYADRLRGAGDLDFAALARASIGLTPAAIASIANGAALLAAREGAEQVAMAHFIDAIETQRIGEKPDGVSPLSESERKRIAVHEAGHALVAAALRTGQVEKVTILPRGQALGVTLVTPAEDKRLHLESELRARIRMLLAGRGAERLYFDEVSSGAGQDLQEASRLALSMVGSLGMGPDGSLLSLQAVREARLEHDGSATLAAADTLLRTLDGECLLLLQRLRPALDEVVEQLLAEETVPGEAIREAIARLPLHDLQAACEGLSLADREPLARVASSRFDTSAPGPARDSDSDGGPCMA